MRSGFPKRDFTANSMRFSKRIGAEKKTLNRKIVQGREEGEKKIFLSKKGDSIF